MSKTITEGNKLIAEFMKISDFKMNVYDRFLMDTPYSTGWFSFEDLEYNTSWDWLMAVVEKIETLEDNDGFIPYSLEIERNECTVKDYRNGVSVIEYIEGETKIDAVYKCVVSFIEWHNEQKQ